KMKRKNNNIMLKWIVNIGLSILSLIALFPIISLVISSFRPYSDLMREGFCFNIVFCHFNLDNYIYIFTLASYKWYSYGYFIYIMIVVISVVILYYDLSKKGIRFKIDIIHLNLNNYMFILTQSPEYWSWYGNSLVISAITIVLSLFFSSMVGYALALYDFKGR